FSVRHAEFDDLKQLIALENEWPENARASPLELEFRLDRFKQGFFIAEDDSGIIASIICSPYFYQPKNISAYQSWKKVVSASYACVGQTHTNALYIVSGTTKPQHYGRSLFDAGINHVVNLGKTMKKEFIVAGCLLPGYANYIQKYGMINAVD